MARLKAPQQAKYRLAGDPAKPRPFKEIFINQFYSKAALERANAGNCRAYAARRVLRFFCNTFGERVPPLVAPKFGVSALSPVSISSFVPRRFMVRPLLPGTGSSMLRFALKSLPRSSLKPLAISVLSLLLFIGFSCPVSGFRCQLVWGLPWLR